MKYYYYITETVYSHKKDDKGSSYHDNKDTQLTQPDIIINKPSQEGIDNNINTLLLYR